MTQQVLVFLALVAGACALFYAATRDWFGWVFATAVGSVFTWVLWGIAGILSK